jgi:hypothetical protein
MVAEQFGRDAAEHVGGVFELQVFATHGHDEVGLDAAGLLADRILFTGGCNSTPLPTPPHPGSLPMRWRAAFRPRACFIPAKGNALGSAAQDEPCRPRACFMRLRPVMRLEWMPQGSPPGNDSRFQRSDGFGGP